MAKPPNRPARRGKAPAASPMLAKLLGQNAASLQLVAAAQPTAFQQAHALWARGELGQALVLAEQSVKTEAPSFSLLNLLGILRAQHRQFDGAREAWTQALQLQPGDANVLSNLGRASYQLGDLDGSVTQLRAALVQAPDHVDAWLNLGVTLKSQHRLDDALAAWQRVLALSPGHVQSTFNIATLHQHRFDFEAAKAWYLKTIELDPSQLDARANLLFAQHYLMPQRPDEIAAQARSLGASYAALAPRFADWRAAPQPEKRLRIGLVSADLRDHPVGYFLEALLAESAAREFDWVAYANSPYVSAQTRRLQAHVSQWHTVYTWSDAALAQRIHDDGIDVLIDLSGLTAGHRMGVFARQPAPLQVTWLGYFGTTGLPAMDAVIADPACVPPQEEGWFSEQVWRLPYTRFAFAPPREAPAVSALPALQRGHITFGCFQELAKVNDAVLRLWGRISQAAPTARWRLQTARLTEGREDRDKLLARMAAAGMDVMRVSLHGNTPRPEYLAAHDQVDVLLDTFSYPGGTTTTEALWMGVPTLTLATPGMLGRQGEGLLKAAQLSPFWVCHDEVSYVERATALAQPSAWDELATLRTGLREHVAKTPLFDGHRFASDWVKLVRAMWRDACERGWPVTANSFTDASADASTGAPAARS